MRRWLGLASAALLTSACAAGASPGEPSETPLRTAAHVTRVVDGDTVHVDLDGVDVTIRLIGIDTPESVAPGQPVECYARRASRFATRRLEGRDVDLEFDVERLDRYDRTLAYVWLDEELFNETLVAGGYASVTTYPPNVRYVDRFIRAQAAARAAGIGIWGACPDP